MSFTIPAGQTLALVGESGCGKTTTGKAIVQLLRGRAVIEGQALFRGQDLFALEGGALLAARRSVQIIFQESSRRASARCARNWAALHAAAPSRA